MSSLSTKVSSAGPNWFGISMILMGFVLGYGANSVMEGGSLPGSGAAAPAKEVAAAPTPAAPSAPSAKSVTPPDKNGDWIRGNPDAEISVIEWSDYECPFCSRHHPTMQAIIDEYGDDVNWVYRHFPLSFHPNAQPAAEASECAGELGGNDAFWAFSDLLFEQGPDTGSYAGYASEIGLDASAFQTCLDSGKYAQKIKDQMADGQSSGVNGTPGNVVYNNKTKESRLISGAQPLSNFKPVIEELMN